MNGRTRIGLLLGALSLLLGACSSTHYVRIRHPLHVGQVDPNEVPFQAAAQERTRGLQPGTLSDVASLAEVTPERVCTHMSLWTLDEVDQARGDYNNYRISMLNDQDGVEVTNGQIQMEQPITQAHQGHVARRVPAGTRSVCAQRTQRGGCVRYRQEQVYRTIYEPHVWQVTQHPATMCFPNGGFVTPSTTRVSVEMDARGPGSMTFQWEFDSAVAGGPPPQQ